MKIVFVAVTCVLIVSTCSIEDNHARAANFFLFDIDSNPVVLDSLLSTGPVVMCLWALWAKISIRELDELNVYHDEFSTMRLRVLAISQDRERSIPNVELFVEEHQWKYIVVLDPDNIIRKLYDVLALPTTYVIDQNGNIVFTHLGYKPGDELYIVDTLRYLFDD